MDSEIEVDEKGHDHEEGSGTEQKVNSSVGESLSLENTRQALPAPYQGRERSYSSQDTTFIDPIGTTLGWR